MCSISIETFSADCSPELMYAQCQRDQTLNMHAGAQWMGAHAAPEIRSIAAKPEIALKLCVAVRQERVWLEQASQQGCLNYSVPAANFLGERFRGNGIFRTIFRFLGLFGRNHDKTLFSGQLRNRAKAPLAIK